MKVKDLILELSKLNPEMEIMILDGFNGGGYPRTINYGIGTHLIGREDIDNCADCGTVGRKEIYVMGFGCY